MCFSLNPGEPLGILIVRDAMPRTISVGLYFDRDNSTAPEFLTTNSTGLRHSVSRSAIYCLLRAGKIIGRKRGSSTRIITGSLDKHMTESPDFQ
jgi:hypothetical protein